MSKDPIDVFDKQVRFERFVVLLGRRAVSSSSLSRVILLSST
jgi:hypothetical protein